MDRKDVEAIVKRVLEEMGMGPKKEKKVIITVVGKDRPGIVASISGKIASFNVNILEISQTILSGYFTMTMVCDLSTGNTDFSTFKHELEKEGERIGVRVYVQDEEIFRYTQRI